MKQFSITQALTRFYDPEVYRDLGRNWKGIGLVFCLIAALYSAIFPTILLKNILDKNNNLFDELPKFTYNHTSGTLTSDPEKKDLKFNLGNGRSLSLIIDTSREYSLEEQKESSFIIDSKGLIVSKDFSKSIPFLDINQQINWSESLTESSTFSKDDVPNRRRILIVQSYIFNFLISALELIFNTAIIAITLTIFSRIMRLRGQINQRSFSTIMRLTAFCGCPAYFIDAIIRHNFSPTFFTSLVPTLIHVYFLMKALRSLDEPNHQ